MAEEKKCQQCGTELPANAPGGVCPKCIMRLGLPTGADPEQAPVPDDRNAAPTGATPPGGFVPPEPAELAKKLPGLEIIELLGQGGMGAVYKARQKQLDRIVALKILPTEISKDPAFAERFTREARSLARLNHPHIVTLYEFGQSNGLYYFIMEFVDGTDLRQVIRAGDLAPDQALVIVPQICEALQYAHEEGIVHRDIKPENIFLDKKGRVKIGDFGLAKILNKSPSAFTLTQPLQRMGTPHYMAPEQIEGAGNVDHRADIYSLGVVFYEMLTGELPLGRFAPPSKKVQVDVRLDEIVLHTLEKEPELRYQHASEVKTEVESVTHPAASAVDATLHQKETHTQTVAASRSDLTQFQRAPSRARLAISGSFWLLMLGVIGLGRTIARTQPTMHSFTGQGGWYYPWSYHYIKAFCAAISFVCFLILWLTSRKWKSTHHSLIARRLAAAVSRPEWLLGHFWLLVFVVLLLGRKVARTQPVRYHFFGMGGWLEPFTYNTILGACLVASVFCLLWAWRQAKAQTESLWAERANHASRLDRGHHTKRTFAISLITIGLVVVALLVPVGIVLTFSLRRGEGFRPNPITIFRSGPEASAEKIGDLDFPSGTEDYVESGPDGPTLSEQCIETFDLKPSEILAVNEILRNAHKEYFELEAGNTTRRRTGDHLEVTIAPFRKEALVFLEKLWADLDKALDTRKQAVARRHLPLRKMFGALEFGQPTVMITIDKDGSFFNYDLKYEWPKDSGRIGGGGTGRTNKLDPEYRRLWDQSSTGE